MVALAHDNELVTVRHDSSMNTWTDESMNQWIKKMHLHYVQRSRNRIEQFPVSIPSYNHTYHIIVNQSNHSDHSTFSTLLTDRGQPNILMSLMTRLMTPDACLFHGWRHTQPKRTSKRTQNELASPSSSLPRTSPSLASSMLQSR